MIPGSLARRYARALIELAKTPTQRDKFAKDLEQLSAISKQSDETGTPVLSILAAERFSASDRKKLLGSLARKVMADPMVVKFLELVIDRDRMSGLPDIARAYQRMSDEAAGRLQAHITSATPLAPDALTRIKSALEKATGKTVVTSTSVDPELIGGVVARVGSYVIDGSVKSTLAQLRSELRS
jgi:F-type H+-transporting ATPase subunit delta